MIPVLLRIARTQLMRDRPTLVMTFVLPIAFFSIFAAIFGRPQLSAMPRVSLAVVDEDRSDMSRMLLDGLRADSSLSVRDSLAARGGAGPRRPLDRAAAERLVRGGEVPVALVLPAGWSGSFPSFAGGAGVKALLLNDPSDPVARAIALGLLQRAGARVLRGGVPPAGADGAAGGADLSTVVATETRDVLGDNRQGRNMVAFYAAGIAVMFLLFSCSAGGGSLLDEQESGTLERVLTTRVGMAGLLAGKWLHLVLLGVAQITVMFVWGALVFRLDLAHHVPGFVVMTVATAAAAAAFGLVLATLARTRQQLSGFSTLIILSMSALGGSMFPRFLMSEGLQRIGLVTFNAWALDGYQKVFWRELPLAALAPQVGVLTLLTLAFLALARTLARRWERA